MTVGENVYRTHGNCRLIEEQVVDILADIYYIPIAMHNVSSPIATIADA